MNEMTNTPIPPPVSTEGASRMEAPTNGAKPQGTATSREIPADAMILLAVRNVVLFPGIVAPLSIGRERTPDVEEPGPDDLHWVGTTATILRYITTDGTHHAIVKGLQRFRVLQFLDGYPFPVARVQLIEESTQPDAQIEGRARAVRERATEILQMLPQVPAEVVSAFEGVEGPGALADFIAGMMDITPEEKQGILETFDLKARLDKILELLTHRIEVLKVSREVDERTRESIGDANRKHLLREQMRTIQKELGEDDEGDSETADLEKAINEAKMPEDVEKHARKELARLKKISDASPEHSMVRSYLEWLVELPWADAPQTAIDIAEARRILDEDHYGLEKIKRRILEHLAVRKLNPKGRSPMASARPRSARASRRRSGASSRA